MVGNLGNIQRNGVVYYLNSRIIPAYSASGGGTPAEPSVGRKL